MESLGMESLGMVSEYSILKMEYNIQYSQYIIDFGMKKYPEKQYI